MTESEALDLMALPKFGEPPQEWRQHKTHRGLCTIEFGVVDPDGAALPGLHVEICALRDHRLAGTTWKLTLFSSDGISSRRVFQFEVSGRAGLRPGDHAFPHEHVLEARQPEDPSWHGMTFDAMLGHFCRRCSLTLTQPIADLQAFVLR